MTIFCVFVSTAYVTTNTLTNQIAENVSNRDGIFQPELERSVLCDCDTFDYPLPNILGRLYTSTCLQYAFTNNRPDL
jgi:hypothetical protein